MKWNEMAAGTYKGALDRLWVAFGDNAGAIATRINTDTAFLGRMVEFALNSVRHAPELRLRLRMPPKVAMVAAVRWMETDPTVEFAIYRRDFNAGRPDSSLVSEGNFGEFKVRNFFPGSGCGFILKDGEISFAAFGLQNFKGKRVTFLGDSHEGILVVWQDEAVLRHKLAPDFMDYLTTVMKGFPMVLR